MSLTSSGFGLRIPARCVVSLNGLRQGRFLAEEFAVAKKARRLGRGLNALISSVESAPPAADSNTPTVEQNDDQVEARPVPDETPNRVNGGEKGTAKQSVRRSGETDRPCAFHT